MRELRKKRKVSEASKARSKARKLEKACQKIVGSLSVDGMLAETKVKIRSQLGIVTADVVRSLETFGTAASQMSLRELRLSLDYLPQLSCARHDWFNGLGEESATKIIANLLKSLPGDSKIRKEGNTLKIHLPLGPFNLEYKGLTVPFKNLGALIVLQGPVSCSTRITKMSNTPVHGGSSPRLHPHSDGSGNMCEGEAHSALFSGRNKRDIVSLYFLINAWARTYNHFGAYQTLECFTAEKGQRCGHFRCSEWHDAEYWKEVMTKPHDECPRCHKPQCPDCKEMREQELKEDLFCSSCRSSKYQLESLCQDCLSSGIVYARYCKDCQRRGCSHKMRECYYCGNYLCPSCSTEQKDRKRSYLCRGCIKRLGLDDEKKKSPLVEPETAPPPDFIYGTG